ncbi:MAG: hypothetical protein KGH79_00610, partial [Patescibacteria group bacterium]|nr:hypothetical protein [Patescibacteria group bacterium]
MDKPKATPKDFFLWAGAMIALYVAVFNFIALVWDYINYAFPNPLSYYPADPYQSGISWEMATLIVLTPLFLALMYFIHKDIKNDPSRADIWVRRWALYLTLFVAGFTMAADLIYVLYAFLNGTDITTEFLLKALIVLLVAAAGFMHFIADLWGYWGKYPMRNRYVSIGVGVLVLCTIIAGFFIVGTPMQARLYHFDEQKVNDLQQIQSQVTYYYQAKQKLPASLGDLTNSISGFVAPQDEQTGQAYVYKTTATLSFELCATFNTPTRPGQSQATVPEPAGLGPSGRGFDNWQHG